MLEVGELLSLGEEAVRSALRAGASEAEAYIVSRQSAEVLFTGEIEFTTSARSTGLTVRAVIGKRIGMASTSSLERGSVREVASKAVRIARVSRKDEKWRSLPERYGRTSVEGLFDKETAELNPELLTGSAVEALEAIKDAGPRVRPSRGMLRAGSSIVAICNSHGQEAFRRETGAYMWVRAVAAEAGRISTATEFSCSRALRDLRPSALGSEAARRALEFLKASKARAGEVDVVLRGLVMASVVSAMFGRTLTADAVQEGRSPWAGRLGEEVASSSLTLIDDGTLKAGFRSREVDDEGLPTRRTVLIERGVLRAFLYDDYRAKREGLSSTGNAWRPNYKAPPSPSPNCLILAPGDWGLEELLEDTRGGLYVVETIGEWLSDPVRGFLNANVTHAYLIEHGEISRPVSGMTMSCDFFDAMRGRIDALCRGLEDNMGFLAPATRIRGVRISG